MKRRIAFGFVLIAVVVAGAAMYASAAPRARAAGSAGTAPPLSMTILVTGQKQGVFAKPAIPVSALSHEIVVPYDVSSGLPSGKRQHKPISVTMQWGPWTPKFIAALVTGENLKTVQIGLQRSGTPVATIKLTNARLSHFVQTDQDTQFDMTYQKIEWTWLDGGITAEDLWSASAP